MKRTEIFVAEISQKFHFTHGVFVPPSPLNEIFTLSGLTLTATAQKIGHTFL